MTQKPLASGVIDLSSNLSRPIKTQNTECIIIDDSIVEEYILMRRTEGIHPHWEYQIRIFVMDYLKFCDFKINKIKTLTYLNAIMSIYAKATYKKRVLNIRRFLRYIDLDYLDKMKMPKDPEYRPIRVEEHSVLQCLRYFEGHKYELQARGIIHVAVDTGLRPTELYRLKEEDFNFNNRSIEVKNSKDGHYRTVYFTENTTLEIKRWIKNKPRGMQLFNQYHTVRMFQPSGLKIKMFRKVFIQRWYRRNGNYLIGELLLGHSVRGNVTASHYAAFSKEEIKKEYDKVMSTDLFA